MKKLAILGASYLQKPLVDKAKEMGIETHCFAWDNDEAVCKHSADFFYPISVLEKDEIFEKCLKIKIDGITTIATDICMPTISYIAKKMNLVANSLETSVNSTNKGRMREIFLKNNISSPKFTILKRLDLEKINHFNFPLILKPTDRSGSRGVNKASNVKELENAFQKAIEESIEKKVIIEEYIEGNEISVETISYKGKHFILAITDKVTTGEPNFVELQHHQPTELNTEMQTVIKNETIQALNSLNIQFGASHSEFKIVNTGEVYVIEIGARMGGDFIGSHLVKHSTGYDFLEGVINVALNNFKEPEIKENNCSGVYFLSNETEALLPHFKKKSPFEIEKRILNNSLKNVTNSNDRSGYLIYKSNTKISLL